MLSLFSKISCQVKSGLTQNETMNNTNSKHEFDYTSIHFLQFKANIYCETAQQLKSSAQLFFNKRMSNNNNNNSSNNVEIKVQLIPFKGSLDFILINWSQ